RDFPIQNLAVPSRIETAEAAILDQFATRFERLFTEFISPELIEVIGDIWRLYIPYISYYAYSKSVPVREENRLSSEYIRLAYQRLAKTILQFAPDNSPAKLALSYL